MDWPSSDPDSDMSAEVEVGSAKVSVEARVISMVFLHIEVSRSRLTRAMWPLPQPASSFRKGVKILLFF